MTADEKCHEETTVATSLWRMTTPLSERSSTRRLSRVGHDVRVTSNAATLWRWVSAGDGDIVITDVVMPDENAFDMLPRIKKSRPELPVIVMSAQNTFMTAIRASETGLTNICQSRST